MAGIGIGIEHGNIGSVGDIKFNRRHGVELAQALLYDSGENLPYRLLVLKLYFVFGRMYVDIYRVGVNREVKEIARLLIGRNQLVVALHHRLVEIGVTHIAPVDHQILQSPPLARIFRSADKSRYAHERSVGFNRNKLLVKCLAEKVDYTLLKRAFHQLMDSRVVMHQQELHIGIYQCKSLKLTEYVAHLNVIAFKELSPCGHIEE